MDEFVGKARRLEGLFRRGLRPLKKLLDGSAMQAGAETQHTNLVPKRAKIGLERRAPATRSAPGINQLIHSESEISGEIRCPTPQGPANVITPRIIMVPELDIASDVELKALRWIGAFRRPPCKHDAKESVVQFVLEIV